jgi:hypothetical protein
VNAADEAAANDRNAPRDVLCHKRTIAVEAVESRGEPYRE